MLFTKKDRERIHKQVDLMLNDIESTKGHVKSPGELDIDIRLYYGRWGLNAITEGVAFSRRGREINGYLWDEGDRS